MINFIGVGAQKAGTSWIYACLYEHPEICAPIKEIHFFSRPRYSKGKEWYESHFKRCAQDKKKGEFSTSYLYSEEAPVRMQSLYPEAKIIAVLRSPVDRAYSQYGNAIKAGEIEENVTFEEYLSEEKSAKEQGLYAQQLERYFAVFPKQQILILRYEDMAEDPAKFMQTIYRFLDVAEDFVPSMLHSRINVARTPRFVYVERIMHHIAEFLRKIGLDSFVHAVRKIGLPDIVRGVNTKEATNEVSFDRKALAAYFEEDVEALSRITGRDFKDEWKL